MSPRAALDPILDARLGVLESGLNRTAEVCEAQNSKLKLKHYPVDADTWNRAFTNVRTAAQGAVDQIDLLRDEFADGGETDESAWRRYQHLMVATKEISQTCMELMGAFSLRDQMPPDETNFFFDQKICRVTEKLAERCDKLTDPKVNPLLAIPASEAVLAETMVRIIRLRFPDWTIWTLPLVALEYARVVLPEIPQLQDAVDDEVRRRMEDDPREGEEERARAQEVIEREVTLMIADAFGVYVMGPAYVCAAVLLRYEPVTSDAVETSDLERAETMFAVTARLYSDETGGDAPRPPQPPAQFIDQYVRPTWEGVLQRVAPELDTVPIRERAARFAVRAARKVARATYSTGFVAYAETGAHWQRAEQISNAWLSELLGAGGQMSPMPESYELREVLNAAWRSRLTRPEAIDWLAVKARQALAVGDDEGPQEIVNPKATP